MYPHALLFDGKLELPILGENEMHGTPTVRIYEELQNLGRLAREALEKADNQRDASKSYDRRKEIEILNLLSPFVGLDLRCTTEQWSVVAGLIKEASEHPYELYRLNFKSNLIVIILSFKK